MKPITKIDGTDYYLNLSNSKKFCFGQYGDVKGKPLFFFHGWPSSRLQGKAFDKIAKELNIRIISPDRPGYGLSDFDSKRTLLEVKSCPSVMLVISNSGGSPSLTTFPGDEHSPPA